MEYFKPDFMVGLTATPERGDGLDVTKLLGKPVYQLGLFEALARKYLCHVDYRLMTDEIQSSRVLDTPVGKLSIAELNRTIFIPKRDKEIARIIQEKTAKVRNPRVMIFCASIEHAEQMARLMPHAAVLHSKLKPEEKDRCIRLFRSGHVTTVVTVDMLNEGFDMPQANVVVFLRSTASRTVFLQQLGRGLRKAQGKLSVLVLDFVANCERIEMIDQLQQGVKRIRERLGDREIAGGGQLQPLTLTLDGMEFDERVWRIMEVVRDVRSGYTKEMLTEQLLKKASQIGRPPASKEVDEDSRMASTTTFYKAFGTMSWNLILTEVGLTPKTVIRRPRGRSHTKVELTEQILAKAKELGRTPTRREVTDDPNNAPISAFMSTFGSTKWNDILTTVGLALRRQTGATRKELTRQLLAKARELGRAPQGKEIADDPRMASLTAFKNVFKANLNDILIAVGLEPLRPTRRRGYTTEDLARQLRTKAVELGRVPKKTDVQVDPNMASVPTFETTFGLPWDDILKAVGLVRD